MPKEIPQRTKTLSQFLWGSTFLSCAGAMYVYIYIYVYITMYIYIYMYTYLMTLSSGGKAITAVMSGLSWKVYVYFCFFWGCCI